MNKDDWRLTRGQDEYMQNVKFRYAKFISENGDVNAHEHCEFCWHKFMENPMDLSDCSDKGYVSIDKKYWVCEECFQEFRQFLHLEIIEEEI